MRDNPTLSGATNSAGMNVGSGSGSLKNHGIELRLVVRVMLLAVRAARAAGLGAGTKRLVHDLPDGARAAATLGAAAKAAVNLPRRARKVFGHGISHVVVGKDVAGTNDHGMICKTRMTDEVSIFHRTGGCKSKTATFKLFQTGNPDEKFDFAR